MKLLSMLLMTADTCLLTLVSDCYQICQVAILFQIQRRSWFPDSAALMLVLMLYDLSGKQD